MHGFTLPAMVLAVSMFLIPAYAHADWSSSVTRFEAVKGKTIQVQSALEKGTPIDDLTWAWSSSNACFPGTQATKFRGHHVFFATTIPTRSIMTIKVIPENKNQDVSIYAYMIGTTYFYLPPNLPSSVTCEADHKWDRPKIRRTQDHTRAVELNAINHPYNVVVGVSGPDSAIQGNFILEVTVK